MSGLRETITNQVRTMVGPSIDRAAVARRHPEPGMFGPGSAVWAVHRDLPAMMIGGTAGLLLQMLHPTALAGVYDHSNFRGDALGRLRRTVDFITATTYGTTAEADAAVAQIRRIHDHVTGHLPDGTSYAANDPVLLRWVHVCGAWSFMAAYLRYRDPGYPLAAQDRYFGETARVSRALGAVDVPATRSAVDAYLEAMRPTLAVDQRTRDVARALLTQAVASAPVPALGRLMQAAGIDLLPSWAASLHGLPRSLLATPFVRAGAGGIGAALRWALDGAR